METKSVEERLEKLERTTRRYRFVLAGLGITILACAVIWVVLGVAARAQAQNPAEAGKVIRANGFVLEDENGKVRATLNVTWVGPGQALYDEHGKIRASLCVTQGEPMLGLSDENGKTRAELTADEDASSLDLYDKNGNPRAGMSVLEDGPESGPLLTLDDKNGKHRVVLMVAEAGPALAALRDAEGKMTWHAP